MKTLKKVLSLVLALAMVLGMVVTASAATPSYTDAKSITYTEAVKVMSLAGVLEGYTDGSFKPAGTLTRAEATKMIVYMLGLEETSLGYKANFGDINGHWAETPISVAAGLGIVAGIGNGKFDPNGTLTGFQWAKILLCAMGYDAEIEGMLGAGWEAKVAKIAKAEGLVKGITGFDGSKPVAREVAAKMAFNVLDNGFVGYPETGKAAVVLGSEYYTEKAKYGKADSFALRLGIKVTYPDDDMFKRPVKKYTVAKESVEFLVDADVYYTVATPEEDIFDDLELEKETAFQTYVNGAAKTGTDRLTIADSEDDEEYTAQGRLVAFYEKDTAGLKETRAVVIDTYLAKVEKVTELKLKDNGDVKTKATITLAVKSSATSKVTLKADEDYAYAKNDYVLVNVKDADEAIILGLADSKAQKLDAYIFNDPAVKLDGEEEKYAEKLYIDYIDLENTKDFSTFIKLAKTLLNKAYLGTTVTAYYDQYGNVIGLFASVADTDYYVVDCIWMSNKDGGKRADLKADIVDLEGNKEEAVSISLDRLGNTFDLVSELCENELVKVLIAKGLDYGSARMRFALRVAAEVLPYIGQLPTVSTTAISGEALGLVTFSENADGEMVFEFNEDFIEFLVDWLLEEFGDDDIDPAIEEMLEDGISFNKKLFPVEWLKGFLQAWEEAGCPWIFGDAKMAAPYPKDFWDRNAEALFEFNEGIGIYVPSTLLPMSYGVTFEAGDDEVYGLDGTNFGLDVTDETVFLFRDKEFSSKQDGEYTAYTAETCPSFTADPSAVWYVEEDFELKVVYVADGNAYESMAQIAFDESVFDDIKAIGEDSVTLSAITAEGRDDIEISDPLSILRALTPGAYIFDAFVDEDGVYEIVGVADSQHVDDEYVYSDTNTLVIGSYIDGYRCKLKNVPIYELDEDGVWAEVENALRDAYIKGLADSEAEYTIGFIVDEDGETIKAIFIEDYIVSAELINAELSNIVGLDKDTVKVETINDGDIRITFIAETVRTDEEPVEDAILAAQGKDGKKNETLTLTSLYGEQLVIVNTPDPSRVYDGVDVNLTMGSVHSTETFLGYKTAALDDYNHVEWKEAPALKAEGGLLEDTVPTTYVVTIYWDGMGPQ